MRFHLDEHIGPAVAHGLRLRGIDVTTTVDANLLHAPDDFHLAFARRSGRVVFTNDSDFLRFASAEVEHFGITFCARDARSVGYIVRYLCLMHDCLEPHEMHRRVEYF